MKESQLPALSPARALALPCAFTIALVTLALLHARPHPALLRTSLVAGGALLAWTAALYLAARRANRTLTLAFVLRKQHWLQACAQGTVLLYWGWHVRSVYALIEKIDPASGDRRKSVRSSGAIRVSAVEED